MKVNVGSLDKWLCIVVGVVLFVWVFVGGLVWVWIGVVLLVMGLFNFCLLYVLIGMNICKC